MTADRRLPEDSALSGARADVVRWETVPPFGPHPGVEGRRYDSDGLTIIRYELQQGARYPLHRHDREQYFQVLAGRPTAMVGDRPVVLDPGDLLHVPAGVPHGASSKAGTVLFLSISPRRAAGDRSGTAEHE